MGTAGPTKIATDRSHAPEPRLAVHASANGLSPHVNSAEQLCLACGLCCDGTLFDHVRLGKGDRPAKLKSLGLPVLLSRTTPPIARSLQPCAALCADRTCRIYADRPRQCRAFECGVFKDLAAGRINSAAALRLVKQARRQADRIRRLLRQLGDHDEHRPLSERFVRMQHCLEAGNADADAADLFAELGMAVHQLSLLAHEKFHRRAEAR